MSVVDLTLPGRLLACAKSAGVVPEKLVIELTESGWLNKIASGLDIFARLRLCGMNLSIADFGAQVIVSKSIEIGHELGMKAVAEGVATAAQLRILRELNCDRAQGYYFARPMSAGDVLAWREVDAVT